MDFSITAQDYGRHRAGFPAELFRRLSALGAFKAGARIADLGTGTGSLARGFAQSGCDVTGVDISEALIGEAKRLDEACGVSISYRVARAEDTGLAGGSFDVVSAGQSWHWFDRKAAALEARRLLVPGGRLVIAHFDWIALPGNIVELTEEVMVRYNPAYDPKRLGFGVGMYPAWLRDAAGAGFHSIETFSFDVTVGYSHADWRGRVRASAAIGVKLAAEVVQRFDEEHAARLRERFPGDPVGVPHRVFALVAVAPGGASS
jgi:SAM-dependent methyltransferase